MSKEISLGEFSLFVIFYILASLIIYLTTSFSSLAWIIAFLTLLPFYGICVILIICTTVKNRNATVQYSKKLLFPILIFQSIKILFSPASCYGWSQGKSCYSLIQKLLSTQDLATLSGNVPHWTVVESIFPIALLLYIASLTTFLVSIRIQKK
jgi:hypothetical protein